MPGSLQLRSSRVAALRPRAAPRPRPAGRALTVTVRAEKVMVVNTKKGGHAFVGLYLAKRLDAVGHSVTIFNDGDAVRPSATWTALIDCCLDCSD